MSQAVETWYKKLSCATLVSLAEILVFCKTNTCFMHIIM